ncbi:MAG: hypothetical protein ACRC51_08875 [Cetobacterium sp.]
MRGRYYNRGGYYSRKRKSRDWLLKIMIFIIMILFIDVLMEKTIKKQVMELSEKATLIETKIKNIYLETEDNLMSLYFFNIIEKKKIIDIESMGEFVNNLVVLKKNGKLGIVNNRGRVVLPFENDTVYLGEKNRYIYKKDGDFYKVKYNKEEKLDVEDLYQIDSTKLIFLKKSMFGIINFEGKILIENEYAEISHSINKFFVGNKDKKYSIYNLNNKKMVGDFDYIEELDTDTYKMGTIEFGKFAFFNKKLKTEEIYDEIIKFSDGIYLARVGKWGDIIDTHGNIVRIEEKVIESYLEKLLQL